MIDFNQSTSARSQCTRGNSALTKRLLLLEEKGVYRMLISGFKGGVDSEVGKGSVYVNIAFASVIDPVINVAPS